MGGERKFAPEMGTPRPLERQAGCLLFQINDLSPQFGCVELNWGSGFWSREQIDPEKGAMRGSRPG